MEFTVLSQKTLDAHCSFTCNFCSLKLQSCLLCD